MAANVVSQARGKKKARTGTKGAVWENVKSILGAVLIYLVIKTFLFEAYRIPSGSMIPTLLVGDWLFVNKAVYGAAVPFTDAHLPAFAEPKRGEVVVFKSPTQIDQPEDPNPTLVKRLVGMPGDTLEMRNGNLIRNGEIQREPYVVHTSPGSDPSDEEFKWQLGYLLGANNPVATPPRSPLTVGTLQASPVYHPTRNNWGPLVVPKGNYFVLGDNRDNSLDSRYWGWVADSLVRGQPLVVYYSYNPDGAVKLDWITRVRWKRFGEMIQ